MNSIYNKPHTIGLKSKSSSLISYHRITADRIVFLGNPIHIRWAWFNFQCCYCCCCEGLWRCVYVEFVEKKVVEEHYSMDFSMPRPRINGEMFPDFQSKSVTVLGVATEVMTV